MNKTILTGLLLAFAMAVSGQRYFTKSARVSFFSKAPLENIEAVNKTAALIVDGRSGAVQASVLIRSFEFAKALMQEHFNENYLESDKYPRAEFKGTITNNADVHYNQPGSYTAHVTGQLSMHGTSRPVEMTATMTVGEGLNVQCEFAIQLSDYNISIPAIVKDNISKTVHVTLSAKLDPLKD
jgi:hypothetical protein